MCVANWSDRHRRLRRAMLIFALSIFLLSRFGQQPDLMAALGGKPQLVAEVGAYCTVIYIYLFMNFLACTSAESRDMTKIVKRLGRMLGRLNDDRRRTEEVYRRLEGAMFSRRLAVWEATLNGATASSVENDREAYTLIRDDVQRLMDSVDRVTRTRSLLGQGGAGALQLEGGFEATLIDESTRTLRQIDAATQRLGDGVRSLENALAESKKALAETKILFTSEDSTGADDLNRNLMTIANIMKALYREVRFVGRWHYADRFIFGVYIPLIMSVLLLLASAPFILDGLAEVSRHLQLGLEYWGFSNQGEIRMN